MPRISAATVAEHRRAQRTALLAAAAALIESDGVAAATPKAVGARAGVARSTVYEYFASREELLVAVSIRAFEAWAEELADTLEDVEPGLPRLRRYIGATMTMAADGRHGLANALRDADLSPTSRDEIAALHDALILPLVDVLLECGFVDLMETAPLIQAVIGAGLERVAAGAEPVRVADQVYRLVVGGAPTAG